MIDHLIFPHPIYYIIAILGAIFVAVILSVVFSTLHFYYEVKFKDSKINMLINKVPFLYNKGKVKLLWNKKRN